MSSTMDTWTVPCHVMSSVTCQQEHVSTQSRLYFLLKRTSASTESARSAAVLCQLDTTAHHKLERSPFKFAEQHFQCSNVRPCYMQTFQWLETGKNNCPQCRTKCTSKQLRRIYFTEGIDVTLSSQVFFITYLLNEMCHYRNYASTKTTLAMHFWCRLCVTCK